MTPLDQTPWGWQFAVGAIGSGLLFVVPFLIAAYLASDFHARGLARLRRYRQKGTTR